MHRLFFVAVVLVLGLAVPSTPVWATPVASANSSPAYTSLLTQLVDLLANESGVYGVYVIDQGTGQSLGINEGETFHAASTFKLPLNLYLHEQIVAGKVNPKAKLVYLAQHYEGGTGILQGNKPGGSYRIEDLARYSIVYSDNVATNILLRYLGRTHVKDFMRHLGGRVVSNNNNDTCPLDMARYMQAALAFKTQHPAEGEIFFHHLENTVYNDRLPQPLPRGVVVAHKIGNWPATGTYNDVGYVAHPLRPYVIAVFSKNTPSQAEAYTVIRRISRLVWDYQERLGIHVRVNGQELIGTVPPMIDGGHVLVPLREIAGVLGAEIIWDSTAYQVRLGKPGLDLVLRPNGTHAVLNGRDIPLASPVRVDGNHILVPLRLVGEAFGASVWWDAARHAVEVITAPQADQGEAAWGLTVAEPTADPRAEIVLRAPFG